MNLLSTNSAKYYPSHKEILKEFLKSKPNMIDDFTLIKTIGYGKFSKVKLARDRKGRIFELKIYDKSNPANNAESIAQLK